MSLAIGTMLYFFLQACTVFMSVCKFTSNRMAIFHVFSYDLNILYHLLGSTYLGVSQTKTELEAALCGDQCNNIFWMIT